MGPALPWREAAEATALAEAARVGAVPLVALAALVAEAAAVEDALGCTAVAACVMTTDAAAAAGGAGDAGAAGLLLQAATPSRPTTSGTRANCDFRAKMGCLHVRRRTGCRATIVAGRPGSGCY
jgi:hypothetical protein